MTAPTSPTVQACLDILRRTDPRETEKHLAGLATLVSDDAVAEELSRRVAVPLAVGRDGEADGRRFLLCEHNRDGASHRSPWSNAYSPPLDEGLRPSARLRALEVRANEVFDVYRALYYGGTASVGSVYLWESGEGGAAGGEGAARGFAGRFLVQNRDGESSWTSSHVVEAGPVREGACTYAMTSTLRLSLAPPPREAEHGGSTTRATFCGALTRHGVRQGRAGGGDGDHVANIGRFIEETEADLRAEMEAVHVPNTRAVAEGVRPAGAGEDARGTRGREEHASGLRAAVLARATHRQRAT